MKYSLEFKVDAVELSNEIGVTKAAKLLGIPYYTLAEWRKTRNAESFVTFDDDRYIREIMNENAALRKANYILKKEAFSSRT